MLFVSVDRTLHPNHSSGASTADASSYAHNVPAYSKITFELEILNVQQMSKIPVLGLNFTAMRSLMAENRRLRENLETEKTNLSSDIADLRNHISMAEKLVHANRISTETYEQFTSITASLNDVVLKPKLTFRKSNQGQSAKSDLSDELRQTQAKFDTIRSDTLELAQKRTDLAVEEQRLNARRSNYLQEIAAIRRDCDDLIVQKEKLEHEIEELEALCEFWRGKNANSETALKSALDELSALQEEKDAQSLQLLHELENIYETLDEASRALRKQKPS